MVDPYTYRNSYQLATRARFNDGRFRVTTEAKLRPLARSMMPNPVRPQRHRCAVLPSNRLAHKGASRFLAPRNPPACLAGSPRVMDFGRVVWEAWCSGRLQVRFHHTQVLPSGGKRTCLCTTGRCSQAGTACTRSGRWNSSTGSSRDCRPAPGLHRNNSDVRNRGTRRGTS